MGKVAWFFLTVFWAVSASICAYAGYEVFVWGLLGTADEPRWMEHVATLMRRAFGTGSGDPFRSTIETVVAGLVAFLTGTLASQEKSLLLLGVCVLIVIVAGVSYFLLEPDWGVYGGAPTIAALKDALVSVARLNIMLAGAHLGLKLIDSK
jgi:hypothetical protein